MSFQLIFSPVFWKISKSKVYDLIEFCWSLPLKIQQTFGFQRNWSHQYSISEAKYEIFGIQTQESKLWNIARPHRMRATVVLQDHQGWKHRSYRNKIYQEEFYLQWLKKIFKIILNSCLQYYLLLRYSSKQLTIFQGNLDALRITLPCDFCVTLLVTKCVCEEVIGFPNSFFLMNGSNGVNPLQLQANSWK